MYYYYYLDVEVWKTLPMLPKVAIKEEASATSLEGLVTATEAWWFGFELRLRAAFVGSHQFG